MQMIHNMVSYNPPITCTTFYDYNCIKKSPFYSEYNKAWFKLLSTSQVVKNQVAISKVFEKNALSPICAF